MSHLLPESKRANQTPEPTAQAAVAHLERSANPMPSPPQKQNGEAVNYPATLTVSEARLRYFSDNMFGDGGYDRKFTESKVGPIVIHLPIRDTRRRGLKIHDLHHIATGYDTTFLGEAE